jgi:hypothetical protein
MSTISESIAAGLTKVEFNGTRVNAYRVEISNNSGHKSAEILSGSIAGAACWGSNWAAQERKGGRAGNWQLVAVVPLGSRKDEEQQ